MLLYILLFSVPQVGVLEVMCCHPAEELGCYYISYCFLSQVGVLELMCCHPAEELGCYYIRYCRLFHRSGC